MVNIKSFPQFYFSDATNSANMVISLSGSASLSFPVLAIPMVGIKIALPRRIIGSHLSLGLPFTLAGFRTKVVFASVERRTLAVENLTTKLTRKIKLWIIIGGIFTTSINRLPLITTFIGTIRMLATLDLRSLADGFLTTYFANHNRSIA